MQRSGYGQDPGLIYVLNNRGDNWNGRLVLKGYGDPTLTLAKMRGRKFDEKKCLEALRQLPAAVAGARGIGLVLGGGPAVGGPFASDYYTQAKRETMTAIEEAELEARRLGMDVFFGRVSEWQCSCPEE